MARLEGNSIAITRKVASDVSANQYLAFKFSATEGFVELAGAGEGNGIMTFAPDSGERNVSIVISGFAVAKLGASVTQCGTKLKSDGSGKLIPVASDKDHYIAIALAEGVLNQDISVFVVEGYYAV